MSIRTVLRVCSHRHILVSEEGKEKAVVPGTKNDLYNQIIFIFYLQSHKVASNSVLILKTQFNED